MLEKVKSVAKAPIRRARDHETRSVYVTVETDKAVWFTTWDCPAIASDVVPSRTWAPYQLSLAHLMSADKAGPPAARLCFSSAKLSSPPTCVPTMYGLGTPFLSNHPQTGPPDIPSVVSAKYSSSTPAPSSSSSTIGKSKSRAGRVP